DRKPDRAEGHFRSKQSLQDGRSHTVDGAVGGDFFRNEGNIDFDDYGLAVSMVDFMLKHDPKKFVEFIDGIKAGLTRQESMQQNYGLTPQEFVAAYGRSIGVSNLRI